MTELSLYKFINDNNIEWNRTMNGDEPDVLIFPAFFQLEDFTKLLGATSFDDGNIECVLKDRYVAIWMGDICDSYGIELDNVFPTDKQDKP